MAGALLLLLLVGYLAVAPPEILQRRALPASLVTLAFAAAAFGLRGVTASGAVAGAVISLLLYLQAGLGAFLTLLAVFLLTLAATRLSYARKQRLGTAEAREGRDALQVGSNLYLAAALMVPAAISEDPAIFLMGATAVLAEVAADTVSSEVGQAASTEARLITTFERVPAGTNGGISLWGTAAGGTASWLVSAVAAMAGVIAWRGVPWTAVAGIFGMIVDSFLGATLEQRRLLGNNRVNALSTAAAAVFVLLLLKGGLILAFPKWAWP